MIGLDTNVLLRLFVDDAGGDAENVRSFFAEVPEGEAFFISTVVLVEFAWTLKTRYRFAREDVRLALSSLLDNDEMQIENPSVAREAFELSLRCAADFPDALVALSGERAGCRHTMTLNIKAARRLPQMEALA